MANKPLIMTKIRLILRTLTQGISKVQIREQTDFPKYGKESYPQVSVRENDFDVVGYDGC